MDWGVNLRLVRLALLRLAEEPPLSLGDSGLARRLLPNERDKLRRGTRLQGALRNAIDHLAPIGTRSDSERWAYLIAIGEYEERRTRADVRSSLAIGPSSYTRAKLAGLERIAGMLPYLVLAGADTMDDAAWTGFLDTLTPRERYVLQGVMARMSYLRNTDLVGANEDMQGLEDRAMRQGQQMRKDEQRQDDTDARMDRDEGEMHALSDRLTDLEAGG